MATLLDVGILEVFNPIFAFLFVFVIVYGGLSKVKVFGEEKEGLYAVISLAVAFMVLVTTEVTEFITTIAPWFVMVAVVLFLALLGFLVFGVKSESLESVISSDKILQYGIITVSIIIVLIGISTVYGEDISEERIVVDENGNEVIVEESPEDLEQGVKSALFNPKVLGVTLLLLTSAIGVKLLTGQV